MTRFLIEVPHENSKEACERAVQAFMSTGSHFMTNADWGCPDGEHKAWFVVDLDSKEEALAILPPLFRKDAKVITLQRFSPQDVDQTVQQHED
jgi:hypothetical protein